MTLIERRHGVWLQDVRVGTLYQRGDHTWFLFSNEYIEDPARHVLGLAFENDIHARHSSALRLPPWFSNLLPEGRLRDWIAEDRGVSADREKELLAQVGADLPGAVRVLPDLVVPGEAFAPPPVIEEGNAVLGDDPFLGWRFSLAGVGLKFSMLRQGDRLTLPAYGQGGDWIVKLPDPEYRNVPLNEHVMMTLAGEVGIEVPMHSLVPQSELESLPPDVWRGEEDQAYAVRRFDRDDDRSLTHIEDFAQVRGKYPYYGGKYAGNFESLGAVAYRGHDVESLREFARRLAFNVLIANGDAHMKNWSLIYRDPRSPVLSPAYDLVATSVYQPAGTAEDMGLKFGGSRRFETVKLHTFVRLGERLGASGADLGAVAAETVERVLDAWSSVSHLLDSDAPMRDAISANIELRSRTLR